MKKDRKEFKDLTKAERDELHNSLKRKAEKNGRGLLFDLRCVYVSTDKELIKDEKEMENVNKIKNSINTTNVVRGQAINPAQTEVYIT